MSASQALLKGSRLVKPETGSGPSITLNKLYQLDDLAAWEFSDADICAAALSVWTSPVYSHFNLGITRQYQKGPFGTVSTIPDCLIYTFTCKCDPDKCKATHKRKDGGAIGTGNLKRAVQACNRRHNKSDSLAKEPGVPFSQLAFRVLLILWCAVNHRPFNMLADPLFLEIVRLLRAEAVVPCPQTISADLTCLYNLASRRISDTFMDMDTGLHLAIDGWSSPLTASFLGIVVFWYQDGRIWRSVLEFIHLTESHTGAYMAEKTFECLKRFNLVNRITTICLDNASNNDTFVKHLAPLLPQFRGSLDWVRCIAHIINLIAKGFMGVFTRPPLTRTKKRKAADAPISAPKKITRSTANALHVQGADPGPSSDHAIHSTADSPPEPIVDVAGRAPDPPEDADDSMEAHDQSVAQGAVLAVLTEMRSTRQLRISDDDLREAQELFPKISGFANEIHSSDTLYAMFSATRHAFKDSLSTKKEVPTKRVSTRWNSDLACAETHRDLHAPIAAMTSTKANKKDLTEYNLSPKLWELLSEVCDCLLVFNEPTLLFSQKETPLIHEVIPRLYVLRRQLEMMQECEKLNPITQVAAQVALHVLDKYLKLMEDSVIPWIAVVLCPWYKLDWFMRQKFEEDRILEIRAATYTFYSRYNNHTNGTTSSEGARPSDPHASSPNNPSLRPWMYVLHDYSAAWASNPPNPVSLSTYLSSPPVTMAEIDRAGGLLAYWSHEMSRGSPLARMALDILTAPASSVDAERAFSGSRMAVNYRQHRMGLETFRAKMAVGAWFGTPLLQDLEEVMEIIEGRGTTTPEPLDL